MSIKQIVPGVYSIALGMVNAFLIEDDGLTLIDTGNRSDAPRILQAVTELGKRSSDIRHILITHSHADHVGSLAALQRETDAPVFMHSLDAAFVQAGKIMTPLTPAPGLMSKLLFRLFVKPTPVEAATVDYEVEDGDELPLAGGIKTIHTPGHCAGHLAFLWPHYGGVLFAGDTAANNIGLGWSLGYEDLTVAKCSLVKIAGLDFEVTCFGHGRAITQGASARFKKKWGTR